MAQNLFGQLPSGIDEPTVFRTLFAAYPDALIVADASGAIVLANPSAANLLGYTIEELVSLHVDALVPDGIRPRHAAYRGAYGQSPRPRPMGTQELVARRCDGSEVMVEIALSPLQNHGLPLVVAAIRDIRAYPRVQQALRRARYADHLAQLGRLAVDTLDAQTLLQRVPEIAAEALDVEIAIVFVLEPNRLEFRVAGSVGWVGIEPAGLRVPNRPDTPPGYVLEQSKPVIVTDYPSEHRFLVPSAYLDAGLTSGLAVPLTDLGRTIGALTVRTRKTRVFGDDEVSFLESLSNLLATSLQRAQADEALNHAQRLESVGQLTGGIAHDFNNLLTVISGNLQVLEELPSLAEDPWGRHLVDAAARATRRGADLTSKLLTFSRRQLLQPSSIDVGVLLNSLADVLRRTLDQRIRIEVDVAPSCPPVQADPAQLESALLNIAINARDAMPEGGTLRFQASPCGELPGTIRDGLEAPSRQEDGYVVISIIDTGSGMPEEVKERAFEPFFTTKEAGRGTGLGLSTVYGFAKQSKGAVAIDSAPGKGTTFTLYVPRPNRSETTVTEAVPPGKDVPKGLEVLLVEDDLEVRAVVHTFLETLHCKVTVATSGEQALLALRAAGRFDLLLTDIALGAGMRGTELATQAQKRFPSMAVLLMSGFSSELLDADCDSPRNWELLRKPYSREELAQAIARVID
ncbi:PAS domain S-box protein [Piscinibacter koreensis]|uniref:histidine kinase n=1 Tax=Piscinibacter koreensis TaxID=2742824 RepID=A0A7Y6NSH0_9BURK|nr:PAS domain S-box protein [Schlegelella koreensis]NUZ08504.1 PAS domain S-box protein [Schlegelella koreensis]